MARYDYSRWPQMQMDYEGQSGLLIAKKDEEGYDFFSSDEEIGLHADAAERAGYMGVAHYIRSFRFPSEPDIEMDASSMSTDELITAVLTSLPTGSCDLSIYHFDRGIPNKDGYTTHVEPAEWGARATIYPHGDELFGYGFTPSDALRSLLDQVELYKENALSEATP